MTYLVRVDERAGAVIHLVLISVGRIAAISPGRLLRVTSTGR